MKAIQNQTDLLLEIDCQYLPEVLSPNFLKFYLDLKKVTKFELEIWGESPKADLLQNFLDGSLGELEIVGADTENNYVKITCQQFDSTLNYEGANIYVCADDITLFSHNRDKMELEELITISKQYWSKFK